MTHPTRKADDLTAPSIPPMTPVSVPPNATVYPDFAPLKTDLPTLEARVREAQAAIIRRSPRWIVRERNGPRVVLPPLEQDAAFAELIAAAEALGAARERSAIREAVATLVGMEREGWSSWMRPGGVNQHEYCYSTVEVEQLMARFIGAVVDREAEDKRTAFKAFMDKVCHDAAVKAALEGCAEAYETPPPAELVRTDAAITMGPDA